MHVLFGLVMVIGAIYGARVLDGATIGSFGHVGTILLVVVGPIGAAIMSHDARSIGGAFKRLFEAIAGRAGERRKRVMGDVYEVGRALRSGKTLEASHLLQGSSEMLLQKAAPLVLQKGEGANLSDTLASLAYERLTDIRGAEELFGTLSRSAPAFGLIGTILGLVDMLSALKDFDRLGPGMAMAVMSTFYGLLLSQVLYVPLAKVIERHGADTSVTAELLGRALGAIADGRALSEVRVLGGASSGVPGVVSDGPGSTGNGRSNDGSAA